jgi:Asp-tRNA(Asn)/Glu-tRNA(Gln) amidotransferase C subunit
MSNFYYIPNMTQSIDIGKLATLSRLTLSEVEVAQTKDKLQKLLSLIETLKELDLKIPKVII